MPGERANLSAQTKSHMGYLTKGNFGEVSASCNEPPGQ